MHDACYTDLTQQLLQTMNQAFLQPSFIDTQHALHPLALRPPWAYKGLQQCNNDNSSKPHNDFGYC